MPAGSTSVRWIEEKRLLTTRVTGVLTKSDVQSWRDLLHMTGRRIASDTDFRMMIDIRGYEVSEQDREVHMRMREVTPLFLAGHGFTVGFFRLYDEKPPSPEASLARCIAVAHVHHDAAKMERYNELLSTPVERFFVDAEEADRWLSKAG